MAGCEPVDKVIRHEILRKKKLTGSQSKSIDIARCLKVSEMRRPVEIILLTISCTICLLLVLAPRYALAIGMQDQVEFSDDISVAGEIDEYAFQASAGESFALRVAVTGSDGLLLRVEFIAPGGVTLRSSLANANIVASFSERLVETGTFTIRIFSVSTQVSTGDYDLFFARVPGASEGGELPNGGVVSGQIDLGDIDSYSFEASVGESVAL